MDSEALMNSFDEKTHWSEGYKKEVLHCYIDEIHQKCFVPFDIWLKRYMLEPDEEYNGN